MKMRKKELTKLLKFRIIFFSISLIFWNCENNDNIITPQENTEINSIEEKIEVISLNEFPLEIKNKLFEVSKTPMLAKGKATKKETEAVLNQHFRPEGTITTSRKGVKTYTLHIKKDVDIKNFLKQENSLKKKSSCDKDGGVLNSYNVISFNNSPTYSTNGSFSDPTSIEFTVGYKNILTSTFTNLNTQIQTTTYTPTNQTGNWNIFNGVWTGIKSIGNAIGNAINNFGRWFSRLFKSNKQQCNGLTSSKSTGNNDGDKDGCEDEDAEEDSKFMGSDKFEDIHLQKEAEIFEIPLPAYLFENNNYAKVSSVISQEEFDCACDKDEPLGISQFIELNTEETMFLLLSDQKELRERVCKFVKENDHSVEAKIWANGQIELENLTQKIPWRASTGTIANFKYTHSYFDGSRGYYKLEDGSIVVNSSSEQELSHSGDLRDKYNDFNPNDKFYYIKLAGSNEWAELLFNPDNLADGLANLFQLAGLELGKSIGRYVLPIEDIKIIIDGKDFDGAEVSRLKAAGFLLLAIVPGSKALKVVGNVSDALFVAVKIGKSTLVVDTVRTGLKVVTDNNIIKFLSKTGNEIARVVNGVMTFKYTGFGGNIITNANKTTTLIGKWGNQLENIWKTGLAKHGKNTGGLNILGEPFGNNVAEIWANNKKWLDRAISRGDNIRVTANPLDINNVFYTLDDVDINAFSNIDNLRTYLLNLSPTSVDDLGYFGREIRHLFQNGYNFSLTSNQFVK